MSQTTTLQHHRLSLCNITDYQITMSQHHTISVPQNTPAPQTISTSPNDDNIRRYGNITDYQNITGYHNVTDYQNITDCHFTMSQIIISQRHRLSYHNVTDFCITILQTVISQCHRLSYHNVTTSQIIPTAQSITISQTTLYSNT